MAAGLAAIAIEAGVAGARSRVVSSASQYDDHSI
jgi:hypothetical protein